MDILFRMLLGHLVGDYLLQNNWMALNKKSSAFLPLYTHCMIWTACIFVACPELLNVGVWVPFWVYMSHAVLDGFNLVDGFLDMIGGRSYKSAEAYCERPETTEAQKGYMRAYTALVQTVADNTMHLVLLYGIFKFYGVA